LHIVQLELGMSILAIEIRLFACSGVSQYISILTNFQERSRSYVEEKMQIIFFNFVVTLLQFMINIRVCAFIADCFFLHFEK
jgi:hypothetical protein